MLRLRPVLALLAVCLCTLPAGADEDEVRQFKREQLLREARLSVNPANPAVGGIADIRRATQAQRAEFAKGETRKVFERLDTLVGTTEEAPGGARDGMIRHAARLHRWVIGGLLPEEMHDLEILSAWRTKEIETRLAKAEAAAAEAAKAATEEKPAEPFDKAKVEAEIRAAVGLLAPSDEGGYVHLPAFRIFPEAGEALVLSARPPENAAGLSPAQREALIRGALEITHAPGTGAAGEIVALDGITELREAASLSPGADNWRFALVQPDELGWIEGAEWLGWRKVQVALRREAIAGESPQGLVSDAEVKDRADRLALYEGQQKALETKRALVLASFQQMVRAQRHWRTEVGRLGFEIEETTGKCADCTPEELARYKADLARQQLHERAAQQELRLLYITALRGEARLNAIDAGLALQREEIALAKGSLQRFADAQSRTRRETQLARLRVRAEEYDEELREAETKLAEETDATRRGYWQEYIDTIPVLKNLNADLAEVVQLRRTLEAQAAGKTAAEVEAGTGAAPGTGKDAEGEGSSKDEPVEVDPLASVRDPAHHDLNENYIGLARDLLGHGQFDADLVAAHHAATDDTIRSLNKALASARGLDKSQAQFEASAKRVEDRLSAAARLHWRDVALSDLRRMRSAFKETVAAVHEKEDQISERVRFLESWRDQLEDLGVRSFAIRKDRTLDVASLTQAGSDVAETGRDAAHWLVFHGDDHIGTFVMRNWLALLILGGLIVASFFVVRYARRWIDARLSSMAAKHPDLRWEPVTIGSEAREAREARLAAEAARREAEEAALKDASGELDVGQSKVQGSAGEAGDGE